MKVREMGQKYPILPEALEENDAYYARLLLVTCDWDSINVWMQAREALVTSATTFQHLQGEIAYARLLIVQERPEQAEILLERLAEASETGGWIDQFIKIRILQAMAASACGYEDQAMDYLGESLQLAEPRGYVSPFVDEGKCIEPILKNGLEQGKWKTPQMMAYVEGVLRAL